MVLIVDVIEGTIIGEKSVEKTEKILGFFDKEIVLYVDDDLV